MMLLGLKLHEECSNYSPLKEAEKFLVNEHKSVTINVIAILQFVNKGIVRVKR